MLNAATAIIMLSKVAITSFSICTAWNRLPWVWLQSLYS